LKDKIGKKCEIKSNLYIDIKARYINIDERNLTSYQINKL